MMNIAHLCILGLFIAAAVAAYVMLAPAHTHAQTEDTKMDMREYVTLHDGTEPPFQNAYWDHKEPGIYVDAGTGEPLFSSTDKFDSGTGWPSFTKPIDQKAVQFFKDTKLAAERIEVRSSKGNAHLGHVFNDGPQEAGGQRYCMNSAALRFVHKDDLESEGYGAYSYLFDTKK